MLIWNRKLVVMNSYERIQYSTRNLRKDLHRRLKMLAAGRDETMDVILNRALELGLKALERRYNNEIR